MGRTLNIVACSPNDPNAKDPIDGVLDDIVARFKKANVQYVRAATVKCVVKHIRNARKTGDLDLVQVIGHGAAGVLSLGSSWTNEYSDPAKFGSAYVIDSNPHAYGLLKGALGTAGLALVGCWVGDDTAHRTEVADGTTLLFDLWRMLRCTVKAALCAVRPADFRDDGSFPGPMRVYAGNDESPAVSAENGDACPDNNRVVGRGRVQFRQLEGIPLLGPLGEPAPAPLPPEQAGRLADAFTDQVDLGPVLAFPEVRFTVRIDDEPPLRADIIGRGRYLRVHGSRGVRYFRPPHLGALDDVHSVLAELVRDWRGSH